MSAISIQPVSACWFGWVASALCLPRRMSTRLPYVNDWVWWQSRGCRHDLIAQRGEVLNYAFLCSWTQFQFGTGKRRNDVLVSWEHKVCRCSPSRVGGRNRRLFRESKTFSGEARFLDHWGSDDGGTVRL